MSNKINQYSKKFKVYTENKSLNKFESSNIISENDIFITDNSELSEEEKINNNLLSQCLFVINKNKNRENVICTECAKKESNNITFNNFFEILFYFKNYYNTEILSIDLKKKFNDFFHKNNPYYFPETDFDINIILCDNCLKKKLTQGINYLQEIKLNNINKINKSEKVKIKNYSFSEILENIKKFIYQMIKNQISIEFELHEIIYKFNKSTENNNNKIIPGYERLITLNLINKNSFQLTQKLNNEIVSWINYNNKNQNELKNDINITPFNYSNFDIDLKDNTNIVPKIPPTLLQNKRKNTFDKNENNEYGLISNNNFISNLLFRNNRNINIFQEGINNNFINKKSNQSVIGKDDNVSFVLKGNSFSNSNLCKNLKKNNFESKIFFNNKMLK